VVVETIVIASAVKRWSFNWSLADIIPERRKSSERFECDQKGHKDLSSAMILTVLLVRTMCTQNGPGCRAWKDVCDQTHRQYLPTEKMIEACDKQGGPHGGTSCAARQKAEKQELLSQEP
jgi:hypothetical protein